MSTRLADLTQYRTWWLNNGNPAIREYKLAPGYYDNLSGFNLVEPLTATVPTDGKTVMLGGNTCQCGECVEARKDKSGPMTLSKAVAILNEHSYRGRQWKLHQATNLTWINTDDDGESIIFEPFEFCAIAEKLVREGK